MSTLGCFACSELAPGRPCPNANNDATAWQADADKYSETQTSGSELCSVIVGKSGRIYHQGFVNQRQCSDPNYIRRLAINVARKFQDSDSQIKCCSTSGCNWSWSAAVTNQGLTDTSDDSTVLFGIIGVISLGLILLLGSLLCCFVFFWRKKNEDENDETLYFPRSTYDAKRQKEAVSPSRQQRSMYDSSPVTGRYSEMSGDRESSTAASSPPVSRDSRRISVREADMYNYDFKDKWEGTKEPAVMPKKYTKYDQNGYRIDRQVHNERYTSQAEADPADSAFDPKYDSVDKDWIDVKSNKYFSSLDQPEQGAGAPGKKGGKRPDWRADYGSDRLAAPTQGSTNPFVYSEDGHIQ